MVDVVLNASDELVASLESACVLHWQSILVLLSNQSYGRLRSLTFSLLRNFFFVRGTRKLCKKSIKIENRL
jgi:hypothetical protein